MTHHVRQQFARTKENKPARANLGMRDCTRTPVCALGTFRWKNTRAGRAVVTARAIDGCRRIIAITVLRRGTLRTRCHHCLVRKRTGLAKLRRARPFRTSVTDRAWAVITRFPRSFVAVSGWTKAWRRCPCALQAEIARCAEHCWQDDPCRVARISGWTAGAL